MARQLRDAQCHTIWEGTENILCIDVRRAMRGEQAHLALLARAEQALEAGAGHKVLAGALDTVAASLRDTRLAISYLETRPRRHGPAAQPALRRAPGRHRGGRPAGRGGGVGARPRRRRPQGGGGPALREPPPGHAGAARHHRPRPHRCSTCSSRSCATGRSTSPTSPREPRTRAPTRRAASGPWGRSPAAQGGAVEGVRALVDAAARPRSPSRDAPARCGPPHPGAWPRRWRTSCTPPGAAPRPGPSPRRTPRARGRHRRPAPPGASARSATGALPRAGPGPRRSARPRPAVAAASSGVRPGREVGAAGRLTWVTPPLCRARARTVRARRGAGARTAIDQFHRRSTESSDGPSQSGPDTMRRALRHAGRRAWLRGPPRGTRTRAPSGSSSPRSPRTAPRSRARPALADAVPAGRGRRGGRAVGL